MIRTTTAVNWIILPYVNNIGQTAEAITDCLAQTLPDVHLLLIDNGSEALGRDLARGAAANWKTDRICTWRHDPPLPSLAATWNAALRFVWEAGEGQALVVNNDVRLPHHLYADLLGTQRATGAWFVTATNVGDAWYPGMMGQGQHLTDDFLRSRGGPDFSCFLITEECHRWFQFDEGFRPAYHEDNDYHRRLQLAGLGEKIFSVCIPYLHYGSGTLKSDPAFQATWGQKFAACQAYYQEKWGGLPGSETYEIPFQGPDNPNIGKGYDLRYLYLGQGKAPHVGHLSARELFDGQAT